MTKNRSNKVVVCLLTFCMLFTNLYAVSAFAESMNRETLQALVDANNDKTADGFKEESFAVFAEALSAAKETLANTGASDAEVETAYTTLKQAVNELVP